MDINMIKFIIKPIDWIKFEPIDRTKFISSDADIDKMYCRIPTEIDNSPESIAYRRIKSIANADTNNVNWDIAIKCVTEDINTISNLIRSNKIKFPEELKEFTENCIAIFDFWDNHYRDDFNLIKEYRDSIKLEKSIEEMDKDELIEYIKKHNIK